MDFYNTIGKNAKAEFKDRGSHFIAYAFPVGDTGAFKERLNEIKKEHPKATHHCFAYRLGPDGNNFRVSDDGEPSGTAGRPILGQIDSRELVDTLVIVVRYFGGIMLGVPGLIQAYRSAAALALQMTPPIQQAVERQLIIRFDYTQVNGVMTLVKQCQCRVLNQEIQLFSNMTIAVPMNRLDEMNDKLRELRDVEIVEILAPVALVAPVAPVVPVVPDRRK
jgi:uncharacterized YigZ family protein